MKRFLLLALVFSVIVTTGPVLADGEFYVIAGGGGVGTKISSLPYTISTPGFYYLSKDLSTSGAGITVNASHVTIDLMGFGLIGTDKTNTGIYMSGKTNVEVRNGTVRFFEKGIEEDSVNGANHRIINVRAVSNQQWGISLNGKNHLVKGCTGSNNNSGINLSYGTVSGCVACGNSAFGIDVGTGMIKECEASYNNIGINLNNGGSVIGSNAIFNSTYGITIGLGPILVDRNAATGNNTANYLGGGSSTVWGQNAGK